MVERICSEIRLCLERNFHLSALALALILPDICGKTEFPDERNNNRRYTDWYDKHIGQYWQSISKSEEDGLADLPYLSGELVYQLRCSFLHSGDTDIDVSRIHEEANQITVFNLKLYRYDDILAEGTSTHLHYGKDGSVDCRRFDVNVSFLCKILSNAALDYYRTNKEQFGFFSYNIIDCTNEKEGSETKDDESSCLSDSP